MNEPREHHMQMKYQLASMASGNPTRFFSTFGPGGDPRYLADLWDAIGQKLPLEQRVPSDGVASSLLDGVLVLVLPVPAASNEAYFVGATRTSEGCRVFCLERSAEDGVTMLIEIAGMSRTNFGKGPPPDVSEFVAAVRKIVGEKLVS